MVSSSPGRVPILASCSRIPCCWNGERRMTVLFVTHSVPEAVFLSDRIMVMTPRPGRVDRMIDIELPRPRTLAMREMPEFARYIHEILDLFLARGILREH